MGGTKADSHPITYGPIDAPRTLRSRHGVTRWGSPDPKRSAADGLQDVVGDGRGVLVAFGVDGGPLGAGGEHDEPQDAAHDGVDDQVREVPGGSSPRSRAASMRTRGRAMALGPTYMAMTWRAMPTMQPRRF